MDAVIDTLTGALAQILRVPCEFRNEFIGRSLSVPSDTEFLYEGEGDVIKQHLLDESVAPNERDTRLQYVEEAAESLAEHHVAMLDAYKQSIIHGIDELVGRLNPETHREAVVDEHELLSYLPVLVRPLILKRIRTAWDALPVADWDVAEQRIFRPAFEKAYLAEMSVPHSSEETEDGAHSHR